MPATPAWPPSSLPRLYVADELAPDGLVTLEGQSGNYLGAVLRLGPGDRVKLFDDKTGEWLADIVDAGKKRVVLRIGQKLREREAVPDLWLVFAPIKRGRIDWIAEKASELGVARLVPVLTHRTIVDRINTDRLLAHMIEAAEQCERTALPSLDVPRKLDRLLADWPADRSLLFADEHGGTPLAQAAGTGPAAILIGPEGGFTPEERESIRAVPQAVPVSLGRRILRADTAAVAAVSVWMAAAGDWDRHGDR
ncbi:MAG TPA: 16S rRNA (uracil(1498)-N(3))-methyltransferase [Allosphingosinicella sp.]|jgi:16S rRNA (uracil1498-N3)-methyltransferase